MKDSFIVYKEWNALIRTLDDAQRLAFYDLLFEFDGTMPEIKNDNHLKGVVNFVFLKVIDNDDKFQEKSQKSRESAYARWNKHRDKTDANALIALRQDATTSDAMLNEHVNGNEHVPEHGNVGGNANFGTPTKMWWHSADKQKLTDEVYKHLHAYPKEFLIYFIDYYSQDSEHGGIHLNHQSKFSVESKLRSWWSDSKTKERFPKPKTSSIKTI
jgi:hypothetical protein